MLLWVKVRQGKCGWWQTRLPLAEQRRHDVDVMLEYEEEEAEMWRDTAAVTASPVVVVSGLRWEGGEITSAVQDN